MYLWAASAASMTGGVVMIAAAMMLPRSSNAYALSDEGL
jgi:hypothetical protein